MIIETPNLNALAKINSKEGIVIMSLLTFAKTIPQIGCGELIRGFLEALDKEVGKHDA